jgi:hypothetical protein
MPILTFSPTITPTPTSSLNDGLVGMYNFENNGNDSSSYGVNGTPYGGLSYPTGKIGQAGGFNGVNAYVGLPDNSFQFIGNYTINVWINLSDLVSTQFIFGNDYIPAPYNVYWGYSIYLASSTLNFTQYNGVNSTTNTLNAAWGGVGSWRMCMFEHTFGVGNKIYFDNVEVASNTNTQHPIFHPSVVHKTSIGVEQYVSGAYDGFLNNGGMLDLMSFHNRLLTSDEKTELYNLGNGKLLPVT